MEKDLYCLIDLKCSISTSSVMYWKIDKLSTTRNVKEAGNFTLEEALAFVNADLDNNTVMIPQSKVEEFLSVTV
ncbi:hypothetical protein [Priestia aryabhattai]